MRLAETIIRCIDWWYWPPVRLFLTRQTFRYAVCGGINYLLLDPLLYFLIYHLVVAQRFVDLGWVVVSPHVATLMLVFPITFFIGFWLNRHVAFRFSPLRTRTQLGRYGLSVAGSILLTYAGVKFFVEGCGFWPTPSKVLTTLVTTLYSFLAAKYFSFSHSQRE